MTSVLFVITAATGWTLRDGSVHPTGFWAEEVAEPHRVFSEAGWDITVATPGGVAPTLDELSLGVAGGRPKKRQEIRDYLDSIADVLDHPVAVLAATNEDGTNAFAGRTMTGLSNVEERLNPFAWKAKWLLEDAVKDAGIRYEKGIVPLRPHVDVDGSLYTGQNPASAEALADRILADVDGRAADAGVAR